MYFRKAATVPIGYLTAQLRQVVSSGHGDSTMIAVEPGGCCSSCDWSVAEIMMRNPAVFFARSDDIILQRPDVPSVLYRRLQDGGVEIYSECKE